MSTAAAFTALPCGLCSTGTYYHDPFSSHGGYAFSCEDCGHALSWHEVEPREGWRKARDAEGALGYTPSA